MGRDGSEIGRTRLREGCHVLALAGELDVASAPALCRELAQVIAGGGRRIVVDLGRVRFIDSTALGVLVDAVKRLQPTGGSVALVCTDRNVLKVLRLTGIERLFAMHASLPEALSAVAPSRLLASS